MGRPPKPLSEKQRHRVVVMLRDEELDALEGLAEARGLRVGTLAYDLLTSALRAARRTEK